MSANIIYRTIGGVREAAVSTQASTWGRTLTIPSGWNSIRIGMRLHATDSGGALTSPSPSFMFGVQSGASPTNLPGTTNTTNWIGVAANCDWFRSGLGFYEASLYSGLVTGVGGATKVGNTFTLQTWTHGGQNFFSVGNQAFTSADRTMLFAEIIKGSPNYQVRLITYGDTNASTIDDSTQEQFLSAMLLPDITVLTRYYAQSYKSMAFSESNGTLDTISFWWSYATAAIEVCDLAAYILS